MNEDTAWVLWWHYSDNSCAGVTRVYEDEDRARADLAVLNEHANVEYVLAEVPVIEAV